MTGSAKVEVTDTIMRTNSGNNTSSVQAGGAVAVPITDAPVNAGTTAAGAASQSASPAWSTLKTAALVLAGVGSGLGGAAAIQSLSNQPGGQGGQSTTIVQPNPPNAPSPQDGALIPWLRDEGYNLPPPGGDSP